MTSAALSRAVSTIAELGVADLIQTGQPQPVEHLASASKTHEPSLYRILRFMASHGLFQETKDRHFDHTPLSAALRTDARARTARARNCSTTYLLPGTACITPFKLASGFQEGLRRTRLRLHSGAPGNGSYLRCRHDFFK